MHASQLCHYKSRVSGKTPDGASLWTKRLADATSTLTCASLFLPLINSLSTLAWDQYLMRHEEATEKNGFWKSKAYRDVVTWQTVTYATQMGFGHRKPQQMPHPQYHFLHYIHLPMCHEVITGLANDTKPKPMPAFRLTLSLSAWSYLAADMVSLSLCISEILTDLLSNLKPAQEELSVQKLHNFSSVCKQIDFPLQQQLLLLWTDCLSLGGGRTCTVCLSGDWLVLPIPASSWEACWW